MSAGYDGGDDDNLDTGAVGEVVGRDIAGAAGEAGRDVHEVVRATNLGDGQDGVWWSLVVPFCS